jgi:phage terminase large subunit
VLAEGVIYDFFDANIHTIDVSLVRAQEYIVGVDYGTTNPTAFSLIAIDRSRSPLCWLEREYYYDSTIELSQKTDFEFAQDLKTFIQGLNVKAIYIDPAAASFKAELNRQGVYSIIDANNDVINGIRFVSTMMTTGDFKVGKHCKHTIKEIGSYSWDEKAKNHGIDKPRKLSDHILDSIRYALFTHFKNMSQADDLTASDIRRMERPWENSFYYTPPNAISW